MNVRAGVLGVGMVLVIAGLGQAGVPAGGGMMKPDYSSPRATLLSLYSAMRVGDVAGVKNCMLFDDAQQAEYFEVTLVQVIGPLKLMHALEAKFGDAGRKPFANAAYEKSIAELIEKVKNAQIDINGATAAVSQKKDDVDPNAETELSGVTLKQVSAGQWKVVATSMSDLASEMSPNQLKMMQGMRDAILAACDATLARLARGEFKTADEAYADYQARMQTGARTAGARGRGAARGAGTIGRP